jgi:hypothetical protein
MRGLVRIALLAGAAGSVALMLRAGSRQQSIVLILLFTGWVLSPFLALALANLRAPRWPPALQGALHAAVLAVSGLCLAVYGYNAVAAAMKAGFVYLVVPAAAWALILAILGVTVLRGRGRA